MIRAATSLPEFDLAGHATALPEAAVEAIAALLLDLVDGEASPDLNVQQKGPDAEGERGRARKGVRP